MSSTSVERDVNPVQQDTNYFYDYLKAVWDYKKLITVVVGVCLVAGWFALSTLPPLYTASATLKIENAADPDIETFNFESATILSEVEVLRSRTLAQQVIQSNSLLSDTEINPLLSENAETGQAGAPRFKDLSIGGAETHQISEAKGIEPHLEDRITTASINRFLKNLSVASVSGSHVIQISYSSQNPEKAARIANAVIEVYMQQYPKSGQVPVQNTSDTFSQKLLNLQKKLEESENSLMAFRLNKDATTILSHELIEKQISELQSHLFDAKTDLAEHLARLSQIEELGGDPNAYQSFKEVLNSEVVAQLKVREAEAYQKLNVLSERYGYKHPSIIKANKELGSIQDKLSNEIEKISESIENELKISNARVAALEISLKRLEEQIQSENKDMLQLQDLIRQAETDRMIYDSFLRAHQSNPMMSNHAGAFPSPMVLSYASVPEKPSFPDMPRHLTLIGLVAFLLTSLFALTREKLDRSYKGAGQIETLTGYPCLAKIPEIKGMAQEDMANYILDKPSSILAESVRSLRAVLRLHTQKSGAQAKVVTMTSSFPGEGKSTLSIWLARTAAKSGEKVLLIDGDLRRPSVHHGLPGRMSKTIVDYLTSQAKLEDVIMKDSATGMHKIYARSVPNSALDLIGSEKMKNLMETLRKVYDLIIIDTPACHAVSDANVLALLSDYTLYCVHWNKTTREAVTTGLRQFTSIGHHEIAFVLTNMDIYKHLNYGGVIDYGAETSE